MNTNNLIQQKKRGTSPVLASLAGLTLVEVMVAIVVVVIAVIGATGYQYHSVLDARKADVQITAARLSSMLLYDWKGSGGGSGYSQYEFDDLTDTGDDPCDYDPEYDYDVYNPDDYDYDLDTNDVVIASGLEVYDNAPGPAIPDGFVALDAASNPNYRIVTNGVNYYATLSYKDEVGEPRVLNVCVAWMNDYQTWSDSEPYQSVNLTTYAND
jgi:type II secretory pathway pseudopilin PulG